MRALTGWVWFVRQLSGQCRQLKASGTLSEIQECIVSALSPSIRSGHLSSSSGTEIALTVAKSNFEKNSFYCVREEEKVKTNYQKRRTTLLSGGCFLALLLSVFPVTFAEDQPADKAAVEPKDIVMSNEQPMAPDTARETIGLVGPSGEEIHELLYPAPENPQVVTSAN
jgi:hypothetical protein